MSLAVLALLAFPGGAAFPRVRVDVDRMLARPYDAEVPFGASGDRVWATSPQGWAFREDVQLVYLTGLNAFDLSIRSGETTFRVDRADYSPSHVHMVGKGGAPELTASASFTFSGDAATRPLVKPFRPEKRWTCWSSGHRTDWYAVDFGARRGVSSVDLYFFSDVPSGECAPPESVQVERRVDGEWKRVAVPAFAPVAGKNTLRFEEGELPADALRFTFRNRAEKLYTGLYGVDPFFDKTISPPKSALRVEGDKWITQDDVLVVETRIANPSRQVQPYLVQLRPGEKTDAPVNVGGYPLYLRLRARSGDTIGRDFSGSLAPGERKTIRFACAVSDTPAEAEWRLDQVFADPEPLARQVRDYQGWFDENAARFVCSDPRTTKMYYHRLYNLKKNSMSPKLGRLSHRTFAEGRWRADWYSNVISYGAGHQIRESRWLRDPSYAWGHLQTFAENPRPDGIFPSHVNPKGQQGGRYTDWITASAWDAYLVHPDREILSKVADPLARNAEGWRKVYGWGDRPLLVVDDHWWTGMEWQPSFFSFNGYRTDREDALRRGDLTAYNFGNEQAVANIYRELGRNEDAAKFQRRANETRAAVLKSMWDAKTSWFHSLRASDNAESPTKEIIGIYPFAFDLPPAYGGYEKAWSTLLDPAQFWTKWPLASASKDCPAYSQVGWPIGPGGSGCMWNGPSWPHANGLVMTAMENALRHGPPSALTREKYFQLFDSFTRVQYRNGDLRYPWTGEYYNGDDGTWKTRERDYNHSIWLDPLISGLVGIVPRADDVLEIDPLLPEGKWSYWALDGQAYRGHTVSVGYDDNGAHLGKSGFRVFLDNREVYAGSRPTHLKIDMKSGRWLP